MHNAKYTLKVIILLIFIYFFKIRFGSIGVDAYQTYQNVGPLFECPNV